MPTTLTMPTVAARSRDRRRDAALALPLILVNATAILGQVGWANDHLTHHVLALAVLFAATVESIGVYLSYEAHAALLAGEAALKLRLGSYALAAVAGGLNYSHYAAHTWHPTVAAVTFGLLSSVSPWLWSIRSRSMHRQALHAAGLIDRRSARFAAAKWLHFPTAPCAPTATPSTPANSRNAEPGRTTPTCAAEPAPPPAADAPGPGADRWPGRSAARGSVVPPP
jgi:hypothetical protein